jgi:hypothetical protein
VTLERREALPDGTGIPGDYGRHQGRAPWTTRAARILLIIVVVAAFALPPLSASGALPSINDLLALGQGGGQTPAAVPIQHNSEPPLRATPRVHCLRGSRPEPGVQGRVPAGSANRGLYCNAKLVGHQGESGGFKVFRYADTRGHVCAFYDTALLFPINALHLSGESHGVAVVDMSHPSHPVQTATLTEPPMLSPHESLNLNPRRGLLAAVLGNPSTYPGMVSVYDAHADCRHPRLQSSSVVARLGHESGFSSDGKTFYATSTATQGITAVDVSDPKNPHAVWQGNVLSHGMSLSGDGNRAYIANPTGGYMLILDTSQIQARRSHPQAREISRLTWRSASIPQNAIPFTRNGRPYVLEFDEYTQGLMGGDSDAVGAARIIDISNERKPHVVSNLRLQVDQPKEHREASGDPGSTNPLQGYAAHYCNIPTRRDPRVVACSFISSGLRIFDISNVRRPKEIAYYVAPTKSEPENGFSPSDFAMSKPAFAPGRQVWFSDGPTGFYAVRVAKRVWPYGARRGCLARRSPIGPRNIGRVRLGLTRAALRRRVPAPRRRTKHSWRWCVKGGKGTVSAAFDKHGHVALVTTTAPRHGNRGVHPRSSTRALRRAYPRRRRVARGLVRANRHSPRLFGTRHRRVRFIAVTRRRTLARPRTLRRYLRYAGVLRRHRH